MRIAYDVTPLSHRRTGVGNYIVGALKGMLEAPGPEREIVAFGPASIRGRGLLDETLEGLPVEKRFLTIPFAHATRRAWGALGRPPAEKFLGDFDVMHFTDWMAPPQRSGLRATMIQLPLRRGVPSAATVAVRSMPRACSRSLSEASWV